MRLLVTGGSGYLGAAIIKRAPIDWKIAATFLAHRIEQEKVAAFCVDVRNADAVNRLFDEFRPQVVIHTAAVMSGDALSSVNVDGSRNIARAAQRSFDCANTPLRTRLIHLSTDVVFDGAHAPYTENDLPHPIHAYGESKARAEQAIIEEYESPVIVRTSLLYGFDPIDPRTRQTLNGEMPRLFSDEYRCPILVDDLADALIELAQNDFVGAMNVAGPQRLSRYEFGVKLARAFDVEPRFESALSASFPAPRPRDCTLDISLAQQILKTRLRSVDEVLANQ
jgi:dTDP-4-dehydrorhamnose reductase